MKKKNKKNFWNNFNVIAAIALAGVVGLTVYTAQQPQNIQQEAKGNRGGSRGWSGGHLPYKTPTAKHIVPTQAPACSTISCSTCQLQGKTALCLDSDKGTAYCGDVIPQSEGGPTCISCVEKKHCQPRPACLDAKPVACKLPEPAEGWCPVAPTPTAIPQ